MLELPIHRIDVYFERWQIPELPGANDLSLLSDAERERLGRFRRFEDRVSYAKAHLMLRRVLRSYLPIPHSKLEFILSESGKPHLHQNAILIPIEFNLSHCESCVACAISNSPVGIDVEPFQRELEPEILERILHHSEATRIKDLESDLKHRTLLKYWTSKEAVLKALGIGLVIDPFELTIEFSSDRAARIEILNKAYPDIGPLQLFSDLLPDSQHVLTVASLDKVPKEIKLIECGSSPKPN